MQSLVQTIGSVAVRSLRTNVASVSVLQHNISKLGSSVLTQRSSTQNQKLYFHSTTPKQHLFGSLLGCFACAWSHKRMGEMGFLQSERIQYYHVPGPRGQDKVIAYHYVPFWKYIVSAIFYPFAIPYYFMKPFIVEMLGYSMYSAYSSRFNDFFSGGFSRNSSNNQYNNYSSSSGGAWGDTGSSWSQWSWDPEHGWRETSSQGSSSTDENEYVRSHYTYRGQNKSQNRQSEGRDYYSESQKFWEDFARQYNEYANQNSNSYQNSYNNYNNYQNSYNSYQNATSSSGMTKAQAYKILGLEYGASTSQINQAYKKMLMKHHPDHGGSTEMAAKINEARDVLLKH